MRASLIVLALVLAPPAYADDRSPEETVRAVYENLGTPEPQDTTSTGHMRQPEVRGRFFNQELVGLLEADDKAEGLCLDFSFELNGQDFNEAEIARTLEVEARQGEATATVDARFTNFGEPNHIRYEFVRSKSGWRIADIASLVSARWRLSEMRCGEEQARPDQDPTLVALAQERLTALGYAPGPVDGAWGPRTAEAMQRFAADHGLAAGDGLSGEVIEALSAAPAPASAPSDPSRSIDEPGSYCFADGDDTLAMDIDDQAAARFTIDSWQGGGHNCGLSGSAAPTPEGWVYEERLDDGSLCKLVIEAANGMVRISDVNSGCRTTYCGARAMFEGLDFDIAATETTCPLQ